MWWRALGVAVVLLCVGVAGGYAVADMRQPEPVHSDELGPVEAESPAVPTTPPHVVLPDPDTPALEADLPLTADVLRLPHRGRGVAAEVPTGWQTSHSSDTWTFAKPGNLRNTYGLRIQLVFGQRQSVAVVKGARLAALQQAVRDGNMFELDVANETDDYFEATYIDGGDHRRVTAERYLEFDDVAYVVIAATGRVIDTAGLRDLVARIADSVVPVEDGEAAPKP